MFDGGLSVGILVNSAQVCECVCVEGGGGEGDTQVVRILNTQCGLRTNSSQASPSSLLGLQSQAHSKPPGSQPAFLTQSLGDLCACESERSPTLSFCDSKAAV